MIHDTFITTFNNIITTILQHIIHRRLELFIKSNVIMFFKTLRFYQFQIQIQIARVVSFRITEK